MDEKRIRRISCFTPEQQAFFDALPPRQRAYITYRGKGYGKTDSYRKAGYKNSKSAGINAYALEKKSPRIAELVEVLLNVKKAKEVLNPDSEVNQRIDALAKQVASKEIVESIEGMDEQTAQQVQFFRDIADGKIKTVKKTVLTNSRGQKSTKYEYICDVDTRIKARKELDRLLGLSRVVNLGNISAGGNVNIMIVDASKKDEPLESREIFDAMKERVQEVDGEQVIVEEEHYRKVPKNSVSNRPVVEVTEVEESSENSDKFFAAVGEVG